MRGVSSRPMSGTILVVEDEHHIGTLLSGYLEQHGFSSLWVTSGEQALAELQRQRIQLVLLDLGLPGIDGMDVCRAMHPRVPVIVVTARDEEADRVLGLELGADDYVTKPFSLRELVARIRAVLRRVHGDTPSDRVELGPIVLSRAAREASVGGRELVLTAKEFDLLAHLIAHPGVVFSRETLLDRVWGLTYPEGTRTVDVHIAQLRRKLGDDALITTVRGSGYKAARA
jgi:two-component system, OmpR family, response regulator